MIKRSAITVLANYRMTNYTRSSVWK